jgi:ribonuclease Z
MKKKTNGVFVLHIYFLGTGAGMPSRQRNVTSIALVLFEERGTFWLFDCGEGTQHQILKSPLRPGKLEKLFITHLHGDHLYGIPGLLTSRSYQGGSEPLTLYGPPGLRNFVETALRISQAHLDYELKIVEMEQGIVFQDEQFTVETLRLDHRIDSYGYRVTERDLPGRLDSERLRTLGIAPGPLYGQLKNGRDVTLPDGTVIRSSDVVGPSRPGRIVTILGDTRPCDAAVQLAKGADLLVHEATYAMGMEDLAHRYFHSTSAAAARTARTAGVGHLILTHLSSRYQDEGVQSLLEEARAVFPHTDVAHDFSSFPVVRKER